MGDLVVDTVDISDNDAVIMAASAPTGEELKAPSEDAQQNNASDDTILAAIEEEQSNLDEDRSGKQKKSGKSSSRNSV